MGNKTKKEINHQVIIASLKDLIVKEDNAKLKLALSSFVCREDDVVQNFLRRDAIKFEASGKSRTYLFIDKADNELLGYFTLAINSLKFGNKISAKIKKQLDYDERSKSFKYMKPYVPAYLLALLGKDTNKYNAYLNNKYGNSHKKHIEKLTDIAMPKISNIIRQSKDFVGGQILYLDCEKNEKLIKFYKGFGFTYFRDNEDDNSLMQLMQII